jgi:hypothetical protein
MVPQETVQAVVLVVEHLQFILDLEREELEILRQYYHHKEITEDQLQIHRGMVQEEVVLAELELQTTHPDMLAVVEMEYFQLFQELLLIMLAVVVEAVEVMLMIPE